MHYWLMKTEPEAYSIDDLKHDRVGMWDGVRGWAARNHMRDEMKKGDQVLFYHSSTEVIGVVGLAIIDSKEAFPDPTQFNTKHAYYDPKSKKDAPRWFSVNLKFIKKFKEPVTLAQIKADPFFNDMLVVQRGVRLSIQPVSEKHYKRILEMSKD